MNAFGKRVRRVEDRRLLASGGNYVSDLRIPELHEALHVVFIRSNVAHAVITDIDVLDAQSSPGVEAVFTSEDLTGLPQPKPYQRASTIRDAFGESLLADGTVRFVGEPIAIVLSRTLAEGRIAASLVRVRFRALRAVVGPKEALMDTTVIFKSAQTNLVDTHGRDSFDDTAFDDADVIVEQEVVNQRVACLPMEGRATAATFDGHTLTVWLSTQNAQRSRNTLADTLGISTEAIRVIVPDVGGGFGAKIGIDRDSILVAWAAWRTETAVRWTENRSENLLGMTQGRAQIHRIRVGGKRDGTITAYRLDVLQDAGAYPRTSTLTPVTCLMAPGVYNIPNVQSGFRIVVTNTTPINKYRGAGRPEATAAIERSIDLFAAEIGMDPSEVRRRNLVAGSSLPFRTVTGVRYDSGNYEAALDAVLEKANYSKLRGEQAVRRDQGCSTVLGIGLCVYVEMTGGGSETGSVVIDNTGHVRVLTGSSSQGQGHATAWAMLVENELGIPMDRIVVVSGDTDSVPHGVGTFSSRSLQLGGSAVHQAAVLIRTRARGYAAALLGCPETEVILDQSSGVWHRTGNPEVGFTWAQIAGSTATGRISADTEFVSSPTFPFGAHLSLVSVDTETGAVRVLRHVALDDAGPVLNPVLTEGQRHGGIAQGIGQALFEEIRHDSSGIPLTRTLQDCAPATAPDLPDFELLSSETPTDANPLGVKGVGEAGIIGATPAVQNAVIDAISHLGVRHIDMPLTPSRVLAAIIEADVQRKQR